MREILFRGKRIDNGEWVEGGIIQGVPHELWQNEGRAFILVFPKYLSKQNLVEVAPSTVGQYTGLTDKNGKKIFEGDILEGRGYDEEDGYGVVAWYDGAFEVGNGQWCGTFHENYGGVEFEILGNIHDNPELLEVDNATD